MAPQKAGTNAPKRDEPGLLVENYRCGERLTLWASRRTGRRQYWPRRHREFVIERKGSAQIILERRENENLRHSRDKHAADDVRCKPAHEFEIQSRNPGNRRQVQESCR